MNRLNKTEPAVHYTFVCSAVSIDPFMLFYFTFTTAMFVQRGGRNKSPRACIQCCYTFRSIAIVEHIFHIIMLYL